jgi:hypothetical protein
MKIIKSTIPIPWSKNKSRPGRLSNEESKICRFVEENPGVDPKFVSIRLGMPLDKATSILFGLEATNKLDRRFPDENDTKNKGGMTGIVKFYPASPRIC